MNHSYHILSKRSEIDDLIQYCKDTGYAFIDYETNARKPKDPLFKATILSVSFQPGSTWVIPLGHKDSVFKNNWKKVLRKFGAGVIENPAILKIAWNAVFETQVSMGCGIKVRGQILDAMLAKYLLDEQPPNDLKSQVDYLLPEYAGYDLPGQPGKKADPAIIQHFWENVPLDQLSEYGAIDTHAGFMLFLHYEKRLMEVGLYKYLKNFYGPLTRIIAETALEGVMVDPIYLESQMGIFEKKLSDLELEIRNIPFIKEYSEQSQEKRVEEYIEELEDEIDSGDLTPRQISFRESKISKLELGEPTTKKELKLFEPINFNSTLQMTDLLYNSDFGFEFTPTEFTDAGNPSAGEQALKGLRTQDDTGFIPLLLNHREFSKMFTTYIKGIYEKHLKPWGRIHPGYLMHGTTTGRFSSRNPSFQTMPRVTTSSAIKKQFIAPEDHFFVEIDGSQIELRVVAEISKDEGMIETFKSGRNIHVETAARLTGMDYQKLNMERKDESSPNHLQAVKDHKKAKVLNFTILYGAGPPTVSELLTESTGTFHSLGEAADMIESWFEVYPGVKKWIGKQHKFAVKHAYIQSPFGRKRRFPVLLDRSNRTIKPWLWNEALRQGPNAHIQGTASDITQYVNIQIQNERFKGNLPRELRLVSTVHDSLEYYIPVDKASWLIPKLVKIASDMPDMKRYMGWELKLVDMKFSAEFGINWGMMHEFDKKVHTPDFDFQGLYRSDWDKYNLEPYPHIIR